MQNARDNREKIAKKRQRRRRRRFKLSFKLFVFTIIVGALAISGYKYSQYRMQNTPDPFGKMDKVQNEKINNYILEEETLPTAKYWVLNAGKGESIYIQSGDVDILIDAGADKDAKGIIETVEKELSGELDYLIITNTSERRFTGAKAVCSNLKPKKILTCELGEKKKDLTEVAASEAIEEGKDTTISLAENSSISIFCPDVSSSDPLDKSLMTLFKHGQRAFFAESDAGEEEEARVVEQISSAEAVVLSRAGSDQVNQHVQEIQTSTYIISTSKDNPPSEALIQKLNGNLYATYSSGTIKFSTDGDKVESNLDTEKRITLK